MTEAVPCTGANPCNPCRPVFSVFVTAVIRNNLGTYTIPPLFLTAITKNLKAAAVMGGVTGYVYSMTRPTSYGVGGLPGYVFEIKFPTRVWGYKYPATCTAQTRVPVDVSYIKQSCEAWSDALYQQLQPGQVLYDVIFVELSALLGYEPPVLTFTHPTCIGSDQCENNCD